MAKVIVLDTNFLMIPYQFKIDIFAEIAKICNFRYSLAVLDSTVEELGKIMKEQKGRHALAARMAMQLLKRKSLKIIRTHSKKLADDLLVEQAEKGAIIATQDSALRKRVKSKKGRTIFLRNKKFLDME